MEEKNTNISNKNLKVIIIVFCAIAVIISVSYAFLGSSVGNAWFNGITASAYTVDEFSYDSTASALSDSPWCSNTIPGNIGFASTITTTVSLKRGNYSAGTLTKNYTGIINLDASELTLSKEGYPDVILNITDPSGNEVTSISGLTYVSSASGFDITGKKGTYTFASDYEISSTVKTKGAQNNATTQTWKVTITYQVYGADTTFDQSANCGKTIKADVIMGQTNSDGDFQYKLKDAVLNLNGGTSYISAKGNPTGDTEPLSQYKLRSSISDVNNVPVTSCLSYASSYSINQETGKINLENPSYCCATSCWSSLNGKYISSIIGDGTITTPKTSADSIMYVTNAYTNSTNKYISITMQSLDKYNVDNEKGMYAGTDVNGTTYYFRGNVDNNYLSFAGINWKIIRVNGDGSIRLVYAEDDPYSTSTYSSSSSVSYTSSNLYTAVNNFYTTKLNNYTDYIISSPFASTSTYANSKNTFGNTQSTSNYYGTTRGYVSITNPVGLVTEDEFLAAGGKVNTSVSNYLAFEGTYWGMGQFANYDGTFKYIPTFSSTEASNYTYGIRPVISIKGDLYVTGYGTSTDPFVVITS